MIFWFHLGQLSRKRQRFENLVSLAKVENMPFEMVRAEMGSMVTVEDPEEVA